MRDRLARLFEKKYRVESRRMGRGLVEWTHRSRWTAAYVATWFDRIETLSGGDDVWIVVSKYGRKQ